MRILVVEDKEMHRNSAVETLAGHDLTIVSSFYVAMEMIQSGIDMEKVERGLAEQGYGKFSSAWRDSKMTAYFAAKHEQEAKSMVSIPFDAVLTDMMMPMSEGTSLMDELFDPKKQVPYGFIVALHAAAHGAKFVAVVTDTNHHHSAISAALDYIGRAYFHGGSGEQQVFDICGAKTIFAHAPFVTDIIKDAPCDWCSSKEVAFACTRCHGTLKFDKKVSERKDWGKVLDFLLTGTDRGD